jgi:hypothetical protein
MTLAVTGLEYWDEAVHGEIAPAAVARLMARPGYGAALRKATAEALAFFDAEPVANALFTDLGSFALGIIALSLHATGGITHRRLQGLSHSSTALSRGRASAILAALRIKGFARRGPPQKRGTPVHYEPDARLTHFFQMRFRIELRAALDPALTDVMAAFDDPRVFNSFIGLFGAEMVRAGTRPMEDVDMLNRIGARRCGLLIVYALMQAADTGGDFPPTGPYAVSISALARRFAVSRSHVTRVIRLIESEGLLRRTTREGEGILLPALATAFARYVAIGQIAVLACMHRAMNSYPP